MDATQVKPRQRRWRTKTRTGCMTCRVRRVKCDEFKPWCRRCTSTGRQCDGYPHLSLGSTFAPRTQQLQCAIAPKDVMPSVCDLQTFHLFQSRVVKTMAGPCDESFWSVDVLQSIRLYPALWHACLAFTSVYQTYTHDADQQQGRWLGQCRRTFTMKHYNDSLHHLIKISSDPTYSDKECLLLTCVVYTGLCSLAGNVHEAFNHACHGLKLFYEWEFWNEAKLVTKSASPPVLSANALVALINRLDSQLTGLLCASKRPVWRMKNISLSPSNTPFMSIQEAHFEFDALMDGLLELMQSEGFVSNSTQPQPFPEARFAYQQSFNLWKTKLNILRQSQQPQPRQEECVLALQIRLAVVEIALEVNFAQREVCWDKFLPQCQRIVEISTRLLETYSTSAADKALLHFSFEPAVCEPLYFVASICRSHSVRHEAISLLSRWPRREGMWDTAFAAQICTAKMNLEEKNLSEHYISAANCQCLPEVQICQICRVLNTQLQWSEDETVIVTLRTVNDFNLGGKGTTFPILRP